MTKDPYAKTAGVENHEQLKREYVSSVPTGRFSDSIDVHGTSRLREIRKTEISSKRRGGGEEGQKKVATH